MNARLKDKHHFFAAGNHRQYIYIVPDQHLLVVRFGRTDPYRQFPAIMEKLARGIADAEQMMAV